jgi:hypothetical protein
MNLILNSRLCRVGIEKSDPKKENIFGQDSILRSWPIYFPWNNYEVVLRVKDWNRIQV